ncbi:MAG: hypothetical protein FJW23_03175 [Acidimicrobiia bacterium]|nr:hypothetical protein [Acidimicrobiia bacterium]
MPSRRYTILLADRTSGVVRRATFSVRPVAVTLGILSSIPVLIGLGAAWKTERSVTDLRTSHVALEVENASYRAATDALAGQITSLQSAITEIGTKASLDPNLAAAVERLPAVVKSRAMGSGTGLRASAQSALTTVLNPEDTFGLLRTLLESIETRLDVVNAAVERRNALADATPSIWPAHGWLTSTMGMRKDPLTGLDDYHAGIDIAAERGQPIFATAAGRVTFVGRSGNYGNLVQIDHGFGLETRYGHLLSATVKPGQQVKRGDPIGKIGATGRTTGYHVHYEVLANGRLLNPLRLLTQNARR